MVVARPKKKTWYIFATITDGSSEGYRALKYDDKGEYVGAYTLNKSGTVCNCPARIPLCRHMKILLVFLACKRVDTGWQYCYESQEWKAPILLWDDSREVVMDSTMIFGEGYDYEGWELKRLETDTPIGKFAIWPDRLGKDSKWNIYCDRNGLYIQDLDSEDVAKLRVAFEVYGTNEQIQHNIT